MTEANHAGGGKKPASMTTVVAASTAGTAFEWYDFFLFVPLAAIMSKTFFSGLPETTAYIFALGAFAVGFAFRPIGALIFGRIGDRIGRKATFLVTMILMGMSTFCIGLIPTSADIGIASPLLFVFLRILQGLALGGEWGGAAIYIVEHVEPHKRGVSSSWLGCSAAFGLAAAIIVVMIIRAIIGQEALAAWGWRVPFLFSSVLLAISIWIRLKLHESPVFARLRDEGKRSDKPYVESFLHWPNLKRVLLAFFGIMIAQGAVWFGVFFYGSTFMEIIKVAPATKDVVLLALVAASVPLYVLFGAVSDRIGRKPVMLFGLVLYLVAVFPAFHLITRAGNPGLAQAVRTAPVTVVADPADCSVQFDPVGKSQFSTSCDIAKSLLSQAGVSYASQDGAAGQVAQVKVGEIVVESSRGNGLDRPGLTALKTEVGGRIKAALAQAGYPQAADPQKTNPFALFGILLILVISATALYGPQAAALVEMFPARVRYTALSFPYHLGTGWIGGLLPAAAVAIVTTTGNIYSGLWYPFFFTAISAVVFAVFFRETRGASLD
jgi:MFS family permease